MSLVSPLLRETGERALGIVEHTRAVWWTSSAIAALRTRPRGCQFLQWDFELRLPHQLLALC
eukprot:2199735-Pyramimonas_sp.AAC.1